MDESLAGPARARGILAVGVVFALGAVFGAALSLALVRLGSDEPPFPGPRPGGEGRMPIARMARELDLDEGQREKVGEILERSHAKVREILEQSRRDIRGVLRPDQQERLDQIRPPWSPRFPRRGRPEPPPEE